MWRIAWTLFVGVGCTGETDYAGVRQRCDEAVEAWEPTSAAWAVGELLDRRCAAALGDSVGLEWESFGFDAETLDASDAGTMVLVGLFTVAASEKGTLGDALRDEQMPALLRTELERMADVHGFLHSTSASEVWYQFVRQAVWEVRYSDLSELEGFGDENSAAAAYVPAEQTMYVTPLFASSFSLELAPSPSSSAVLIHEASHGWITPHVTCPDPNHGPWCDLTPEGAYGVQVWWMTNWIQRYASTGEIVWCETLENYKLGACNGGIEDSEDWPPCERVCP